MFESFVVPVGPQACQYFLKDTSYFLPYPHATSLALVAVSKWIFSSLSPVRTSVSLAPFGLRHADDSPNQPRLDRDNRFTRDWQFSD
jgi:hypothetical protein